MISSSQIVDLAPATGCVPGIEQLKLEQALELAILDSTRGRYVKLSCAPHVLSRSSAHKDRGGELKVPSLSLGHLHESPL